MVVQFKKKLPTAFLCYVIQVKCVKQFIGFAKKRCYKYISAAVRLCMSHTLLRNNYPYCDLLILSV